MRSGELAQLAGVTVRALRHYHAIGLLPEPPRHPNGYRDYGADELVRVLRIKRLTTLGFPLSSIGDVLDEMDRNLAGASGPNADAALDKLDRELALQIERLEEQRRTIALLKREQLDPDLPVRFARAAKQLMQGAYQEAAIRDEDREALLIAGHLYTESDVDELERTVAALSERGLLEKLKDIQEHFDKLPADASDKQIDRFVDEALGLIDPVVDCFDPTNWETDLNTQAELFIDEIVRRGLNDAQVRAQDRLESLMEKRILAQRNAGAGRQDRPPSPVPPSASASTSSPQEA